MNLNILKISTVLLASTFLFSCGITPVKQALFLEQISSANNINQNDIVEKSVCSYGLSLKGQNQAFFENCYVIFTHDKIYLHRYIGGTLKKENTTVIDINTLRGISKPGFLNVTYSTQLKFHTTDHSVLVLHLYHRGRQDQDKMDRIFNYLSKKDIHIISESKFIRFKSRYRYVTPVYINHGATHHGTHHSGHH